MAVVQPEQEPTIHEYWPRYWRRTLFLVITMQIIGLLVVGVALLLSGISDADSLEFWITLIAVLFTTILINWIVLYIVTEPLKQLTAAMAKIAGERSPLSPPNPNADRYAKSGLRPLLRWIYEDTNAKKDSQSTQAIAASDNGVLEAFTHSTSSFVIFDQDYNITIATEHAPLIVTEDGTKRLDLDFLNDTSLSDWIKECDEHVVNAEKTWLYIGTRPVGDPKRRVYDLTATYNKGSAHPVSVLLLEKTGEYGPDDSDLNFIAFAAHELRGPITVIRGYLDTLNDELADVVDAEQKELFERLIVSANRLSGYVNNILNSARYDRRHFSVRLVETSIASIYDSIADDMRLRATSQHRLLWVDLSHRLPTIAADPSSIGEVLGNLIDNAIKYSNESGTIEVTAEQHGSNLEVSVRDHGIGMPSNVVSNLFHKFYRSHRSRETVAGTGIGLYISKAIVESNGGTMSVQSVEGEGSTFTFSLPIYSSVADKIESTGGDSREFVAHNSGSWIKNHGSIRG